MLGIFSQVPIDPFDVALDQLASGTIFNDGRVGQRLGQFLPYCFERFDPAITRIISFPRDAAIFVVNDIGLGGACSKWILVLVDTKFARSVIRLSRFRLWRLRVRRDQNRFLQVWRSPQ